jgi:hypothetical protein
MLGDDSDTGSTVGVGGASDGTTASVGVTGTGVSPCTLVAVGWGSSVGSAVTDATGVCGVAVGVWVAGTEAAAVGDVAVGVLIGGTVAVLFPQPASSRRRTKQPAMRLKRVLVSISVPYSWGGMIPVFLIVADKLLLHTVNV